MNLIKKIVNKTYLKSLKWGTGVVILTFIKQIFLVPIFLIYLGKELFGFWLVVNAIILVIRSVSLGQYNYTLNLINIKCHTESKEYLDSIKQKSFSANIIFTIIQILLGLFFFNDYLLSSLTKFDLNFIAVNKGSLIFLLLLLVRIPNQFVMLFYVRLYESIGNIHKSLKYQMLNVSIEVMFTLLILLITKNLLYVCIGLILAVNLFNIIAVSKINRELNLKLKFNLIKINDFFKTFKKSFLLSIGFVIEKIYENGLNAIVSKAYLPSFVPLFGTGRVLSNSALKFSNVASEPLMPDVQKNFALEDINAINNLFFKYWRITSSFSIFFIIILMPFLESLFSIWTKDKLEFNLVLIVSILAAMLLQNYSMILNQFIRRTNNSKKLIYYNLIKVSLTLFFLFYFGDRLFIWGLGVSLLIGEFISCIFLILSFKANLFHENLKNVLSFFFLLTVMAIMLITYAFNKNYSLLVIFGILMIFFMNFTNIKKKIYDYF